MQNVPSYSSLVSASSGGQPSSQPSVFDKCVPQSIEEVEVALPRGLRTHASPRVAGELKKDCRVKVPTRTYNVTVEPRGNTKKAKDVIREAARPLSNIEMDIERSKAGDPEVTDSVGERFLFKQERNKRFQLGRQFPALASPRLVPSWRLSSAGQRSMEAGQDDVPSPTTPRSPRNASLTKPTESHKRKQQVKRIMPSTTPWLHAGVAGKEELISDRKPALHADRYDDGSTEFEENELSKQLWVDDRPMMPASNGKVTFDAARPQLEQHISAMRGRGKIMNESLKERYDLMRENFQRERQAQTEKNCGLSNFESDLREKQKREVQEMKARSLAAQQQQSSREDTLSGNVLSSLGGALRKQQAEAPNTARRPTSSRASALGIPPRVSMMNSART